MTIIAAKHVTVTIGIRHARWARVLAPVVAFMVCPFVGVERAVKVAAWVYMRGTRISVK